MSVPIVHFIKPNMSKKIIITFVLLFGFFSPVSAYAASMVVSGFGASSVNGTYPEGAAINGKPSYYNGSYYLCWTADASFWTFRSVNTCTSGSGSVPYYSSNVVATPDLVTTWTDNGGGTPIGTVVEGSSPSGSSTTVQYVDSPTQDLFYGYILFLSGLALIMWILRGRKTH